MPGTYALSFGCNAVKSPNTSPFVLKNHISNVSFIRDISATINIDVTSGELAFLPIQPIIQINYESYQTLSKKNISVKVYAHLDLSATLNLTNISSNFQTVYDNATSGATNMATSGAQTIQYIWKTVSDGGKFIKSIKAADEGLNYNFSYPTETADAKLYFTDMSIQFTKYGTFNVILLIDGIETTLNNTIIVSPPLKTVTSNIMDFVNNFGLIIAALVVLMSNTAYHHVLWIISAFLAIGFAYISLLLTPGVIDTWDILMFIVFGILALTVVEMIYQLMRRRKKRSYRIVNFSNF